LQTEKRLKKLTIPCFLPLFSFSFSRAIWQELKLLKTFLTLDEGQKVYLSERGQSKGKIDKTKSVCFVIGPEGGWSPTEIQAFERIDGMMALNLGQLILRAETAAISILSAHRFDIFS
jgi:16S rRNA (uracil1498-N3)-methyltransferase